MLGRSDGLILSVHPRNRWIPQGRNLGPVVGLGIRPLRSRRKVLLSGDFTPIDEMLAAGKKCSIFSSTKNETK